MNDVQKLLRERKELKEDLARVIGFLEINEEDDAYFNNLLGSRANAQQAKPLIRKKQGNR